MHGIPAQRWRLVVRRAAGAGGLAPRDATAAWEEAIRSTGLPVVTVDDEGRRPRLAFGAPAGGMLASDGDLVDLWLTHRLPIAEVRAALLGNLPADHELVGLHDVWLGEGPLPARVVASDVEATITTTAPIGQLEAAAAAILARRSLPRQRTRAGRTIAYDLRPLLLHLAVEPAGSPTGAPDEAVVRMRVAHDPERGVGRPDEVLAALAEEAGQSIVTRSLVRRRLLLVEDLEPPTAGPAAVAGGLSAKLTRSRARA